MTFLSYVLNLIIRTALQPAVVDVLSDVGRYAVKRATEQVISAVERGDSRIRSSVQTVK